MIGKVEVKYDEGGSYYEPVYGSKEIVDDYFKMHSNAIDVISQLNGCSVALIIFLSTRMNSDNIVQMSFLEKLEFLKKRKENPWSIKTIDNALQKLKKVRLIRSVYRGYFFVNPIYFSKTRNKGLRKELIKSQLEWEAMNGNS